jgi:hypothetical protein
MRLYAIEYQNTGNIYTKVYQRMGEMELQIQEGITIVNLDESGDYNIQFTKSESLGDVITEFKEFLIACGYGKEAIDEYIEDF